MPMMLDLSRDLVEEVLSRVPLTSLRAVRFTCKAWNDISNGLSFTKKHIGNTKAATKEKLQVIMTMDFKVYLMSINLRGIESNVDPYRKLKGQLITNLGDANHQVYICFVLPCDGLLLCITKDGITKDYINSRNLVVWNPYLGQTMWIKPRSSYHDYDRYALGYESGKNNSCLSHKILRLVDVAFFEGCRICEFELYNFKSNSWKVLDVTPTDWDQYCAYGVSLKGNTYWYAKHRLIEDEEEEEEEEETDDFLICFDFTTERFGPRLPLPFHSSSSGIATLSRVGEDQLAVLFQRSSTLSMEIWVTSKIEPKEVSWNKLFVAVDKTPDVIPGTTSFVVDQKNNAAVVYFNKRIEIGIIGTIRNIAYIFGKNRYFKREDLGTSTCHPPLMCSYVPNSSSVQIKHVTY